MTGDADGHSPLSALATQPFENRPGPAPSDLPRTAPVARSIRPYVPRLVVLLERRTTYEQSVSLQRLLVFDTEGVAFRRGGPFRNVNVIRARDSPSMRYSTRRSAGRQRCIGLHTGHGAQHWKALGRFTDSRAVGQRWVGYTSRVISSIESWLWALIRRPVPPYRPCAARRHPCAVVPPPALPCRLQRVPTPPAPAPPCHRQRCYGAHTQTHKYISMPPMFGGALPAFLRI